MWWSIPIILVLVIILILYKWNGSNTNFKVISECVYKDKLLFSDTLVVKSIHYSIRYDFKEGKLCAITAQFYDKAALYAFPPYWKVYCYGKNGESIKAPEFSQLYTFDTNPDLILELLIKKYKSLDKLPRIQQTSPDVSGRFIF